MKPSDRLFDCFFPLMEADGYAYRKLKNRFVKPFDSGTREFSLTFDSRPGIVVVDAAFFGLSVWMAAHGSDAGTDGTITATFVVTSDGILRLAHRRSEHVACASGGPVFSVGEITFTPEGEVVEVTNRSTGFCPEPESSPHVAAALDRIPLPHPEASRRLLCSASVRHATNATS